jgi:hypothetical protein
MPMDLRLSPPGQPDQRARRGGRLSFSPTLFDHVQHLRARLAQNFDSLLQRQFHSVHTEDDKCTTEMNNDKQIHKNRQTDKIYAFHATRSGSKSQENQWVKAGAGRAHTGTR